MGANQTEVTWTFEGRMPYPMNLMMLFYDMEGLIDKYLADGLKKSKSNS